MALTTTAPNGSAPIARGRPSSPRLTPPPDRQRRPLWALGLVMVAAVSAAAFGVMLANAGHRQAVLVMARTVPAGTAITVADLTEAHVSADATLHPLAASARDSVVGRSATSTLVAGSMLTAEQLGKKPGPGPDESVIGILLKGSKTPPASLRVGDQVQLVQTLPPQDGGAPASAPAKLGAVMAMGRVLAVDRTTDSGASLEVSVALAGTDAPAVVGAAAADRVAIVVVGRGA